MKIVGLPNQFPETAVNHADRSSVTPPLDKTPPTIQARLHKPTIVAKTPTTVIDTFETSVAASVRSEDTTCLFSRILAFTFIICFSLLIET